MSTDTLKITATYQREPERNNAYELKVKFEGAAVVEIQPRFSGRDDHALDIVREMAAGIYKIVFTEAAEKVAGLHGFPWRERSPIALVEEKLEEARKNLEAAERRALIAETQRDELRRIMGPTIKPDYILPQQIRPGPLMAGGVATMPIASCDMSACRP